MITVAKSKREKKEKKHRFYNIRSRKSYVVSRDVTTRQRKRSRNCNRELQQRRRRRQKKTTTLHVHHTFLYTSLPSLHDYDVKMPTFTIYGERKTSDDEFSFLFLSLSPVPQKSTPRKFAHISHFQWIGINATKFENTRIHFKSDLFAAVAVVDAKAP